MGPRNACGVWRNGHTAGAETHVNLATGAFGGAPYGATILVKNAPNWERVRHVSPATGAFGGAPYGNDPREGCAEWGGGCAM